MVQAMAGYASRDFIAHVIEIEKFHLMQVIGDLD